MSYKYILLDFDGTIMNSADGIINCVKYALNKLNKPIPSKETLNKFLGPPLVDSFTELCFLDKPTAIKAVEFYREKYSAEGMFEASVYPKITNVLDKLNKLNKTLIVTTAKPEEYTKIIAKHFNVDKYFNSIIGATFSEERNKKHQVIEYVLKKYNITDLSSAIMVGDRAQDILGAKQNNIKSIGVKYGFSVGNELVDAGADYIINTPEELLDIIK